MLKIYEGVDTPLTSYLEVFKGADRRRPQGGRTDCETINGIHPQHILHLRSPSFSKEILRIGPGESVLTGSNLHAGSASSSAARAIARRALRGHLRDNRRAR